MIRIFLEALITGFVRGNRKMLGKNIGILDLKGPKQHFYIII